MGKLRKPVIIVLIAICFIIPFLWSCFELFALRPSGNKVAPPPNDSKWISYFGIFMGPEYVFNDVNKTFIDKTTAKTLNIDDFYISDEEFINKHAKSTDAVIKSIVKWRQHFDYDNYSDRVEYFPENDKSLKKYVCDLGINYLPHLFYYSKHTSALTYGNQLRYSIDVILMRNAGGYNSYDTSDWSKSLLKDIESIPYKVEEGNIYGLGLLPLPYIINRLKSSDINDADIEKYISLLPDLAIHIYDDIFTDYNRKNIEWWLKWADNFEEDISAINNFINLAKNYC